MNEHKDAQAVQGGASKTALSDEAVFAVAESLGHCRVIDEGYRQMCNLPVGSRWTSTLDQDELLALARAIERASLASANKELLEALRRIEARCPADHADYTLASIGDTARAVLAKHQEAS